MKLLRFDIPRELELHLATGGLRMNDAQSEALSQLLERVSNPVPEFFSSEQIVVEHGLWTSEEQRHYVGQRRAGVEPGNVDPERILIIGAAEPDSPIALDYRKKTPSVVYLGEIDTESFWFLLAPDYATLVRMLGV